MSRTAVTTSIPELDNPLIVVGQWLDEAVGLAQQPNPNAMTLATASVDARPSARVVLVKSLDRERGYVEFFSNYGSRKAKELDENASAAGVMHWDGLGRQLRFEGSIVRSPGADSDAYFATRPWRSRINAWASRQSLPIDDTRLLERRARTLAERFGAPDPFENAEPSGPVEIPRPAFWGGYRFWFGAVELWSSGVDRFHERVRYERSLRPADPHNFSTGSWSRAHLQP